MRLVASVAVQATVVVPILKLLPDPGAHATETGCDPFWAVGIKNVTSAVCPFVDDAVTLPGHEIVGASGVGVRVGRRSPACHGAVRNRERRLPSATPRDAAVHRNGPRVPLLAQPVLACWEEMPKLEL